MCENIIIHLEFMFFLLNGTKVNSILIRINTRSTPVFLHSWYDLIFLGFL